MKRTFFLMIALLMALPVVAQSPTPEQPSDSAESTTGKATAATSTAEQRQDVALTAYNNGLALVREVRDLRLPEGEVSLQFQDVAELIRPETVSLRSLADEGSVVVFEQNYEYDLISPQKLMEKYVGKDIRLINRNKDLDFYEINAKLLSENQGPVYEIDGDIYLGHPGQVVLPEIPENLIAKPSLIWLLGNSVADQKLEVSYLTNGVSWHADYVLTVPRDSQTLDLKGWVTMDNQSGTTYKNAQLKLVAGDVNVAPQAMDMMRLQSKEMMAGGFAGAPMPTEEAFSEFHLYTMPRRTTIKQNQSKQLALLDAAGVRFEKKYEYRGQQYYYFQPMPPMQEEHVAAFIEFKNEEANNMGMPLPAGVMRIYQEDSSGALQFSGEDRIQHTPKDEEVKLRLGTAFDVVAERKQMDFQRIANNVYESAFEIELRNRKDDDIIVEVREPMSSDWKVLDASHDYEKEDAFTMLFKIAVPANSEVTVAYRVRVTN